MKHLESVLWLLSWPLMIGLCYWVSAWAVKKLKPHTDAAGPGAEGMSEG